MPKGLLEVTGTIDATQFWPQNESDADTVKVIVKHDDGFKFSPNGEAESLQVTHVFDPPMVIGAANEPVYQPKITVRLEHIDAPELHYQGTKCFRQFLGETATTELHDLIASAGKEPVRCVVRTAIDHPNEAFDTYGRLIGNIILHPNSKKELNVNHWLVRNGWAFPSFYNSALVEEIKQFSELAIEAKTANKGVWAHLSSNLWHPDFSLVFRPHGPANPSADVGPVVLPKMFRRQVAWQKAQSTGHFSGPFREFLAAQHDDGWVKTSDFLQNNQIQPVANNLSSLLYDQDFMIVGPLDLVFFEKASTLVDAWGNKIDSWWPITEKTKAVRAA